MSRTNHGHKPVGYDFSSRRHPYSCCLGYGPFPKRQTNRLDRRNGKKQVENQIERYR